ncbi:protein unc-13 homolog [Solanum dulcamara]|uniref:protein unc-13 homolog n=1 Tax=Solanum dulcamara TaxID=45834 RepID=UPI0024862AA4|nr:protein unc-13 homolog [Solanum dulcamara]XP_055817044.1 protein unc-13 homolog [Solanum dulcamara]
MEEENSTELLQRFRRDRRILLNFILSGSLIKKVVMPPGAVSLDDVDLDQVSVDFVLNCARKGGLLELSEAIRDYHDSTLFPHMCNAGSTDEFFLATNPELSGLPPRRLPPPVPISTPSPILATLSTSESIDTEPFEELSSLSKSQSLSSTQQQELTVDDIEDFDDDDDLDEVDSRRYSRRVLNDAADLVLGLPSFATAIGDDDLRETAYEILLAAAGASGGLIVPSKDKKKEKKSRLMRKLGRSKSENVMTQSQHLSGLVSLLETMRVQMEISEAMDVRTRLGLLNAMVGKVGKRMNTILIPLELLCCISRTEFSDKKSYIKWQKRQLNMLEEGLINHPAVGFGESGRKANELRVLLAKIEESESFPPPAAELQRTECLKSLREIALPLGERPARGDLTGEVCHWADGYHLNVKLYEKLLLSVFDVLDEGKLTEEVEEILELLKSTWHILGITETIHYTCYTWVLFRQFVITGEQRILQYVIEQLKKIPLKEQRGPQERMHLKSLHSRVEIDKGFQELTFLQSFLLPISKWADKQLGDYHLNYAEGSAMMENTVALAILVRRLLLEEPEMAMESATISDKEQIEFYVTSSIKNAFMRIIQDVEAISQATNEHPLALLAEHTRKLLQRDNTIYMPILSQRHQNVAAVSASILHKIYGIKLRPFLDSAEHLTEDTIAVFPAADSLENDIMQVIISSCADGTSDAYCRKLNLFKIETVSGTLVLRWVNSQLARILNWVDRAIQQERWIPVSPQQRHGSSIVEVYRIVEETVDQFFALKVPMRTGELGSLFRGIDNAFQVYAKTILDKIANKEDIVPPVPILTRYSREHGIKAFVKKELKDTRIPDVLKSVEIDVAATSTLCVQLNSLHYAISQLNKLEDSIWARWTRKKHHDKLIKNPTEEATKGFQKKDSFDGSRKDINAAIDRMCEFTGTKIIFCDLREPFIENLYKPSVSQSRLESVMEPLDMVLNQLCDVIMEPLRDRVVTGLLQASLDGLLRVILDGGPSRVFSLGDAKLLEEDLEILKEFFISGGDGLPRGVVENQVARVRQVIKLQGYETREIIEDLRSASELEMQGGRGKLGADTKTLLRILCHRGDSEASQFVKKQFKIPKSGA